MTFLMMCSSTGAEGNGSLTVEERVGDVTRIETEREPLGGLQAAPRRFAEQWPNPPTAPVVRQGASKHSRCRGNSRHPLQGLNRTPGPEWSLCPSSRALQCELIGRVSVLEKRQPSVSRHPINGTEHLSPTGIGKGRDDIVKAARTTFPQFFNNSLFYGRHGVEPPSVGVFIMRSVRRLLCTVLIAER